MAWRGQRKMLKPGTGAPSFSLRDLEGKDLSLTEILASGPALFVFFKVSCPVCQFTLPFIERMYRNPSGAAMQFFAISQDDTDATRHFCRKYSVSYPALLDEEERGYPASNAFGISHVPSMFLIEPDGVIGWALDGFSRKDLEELGLRAGISPFLEVETVPDWKAG